MTDPLDLLRSALEGRYAVERLIGQGGMATVYLARDCRHDRPVAIKVRIMNRAFPQYVSTVGNDLPDPFAGSYSAWYGDPAGEPPAGNFLGEQAAGDPDLSGGTSVAPNDGSFTSPEFTVPDVTNPVELQLKTWWEIEGVNPASFDLMDIVLLHGGTETVLKRLNPPADPLEPANRSALAYTSAGFNVAPDWQDVAIDLSAYKGQTVRLKFVFNTGDQQYNGFRGWIVDQVAVSILSPSSPLALRTNALQNAVDLVPADKMTFPARSK